MQQSKRFIILGVGVALALLAVVFSMVGTPGSTDTTSATGGGPEMNLTVPGAECADGKCSLEPGASFKLAVNAVSIPAEGYILAQAWIEFGEALDYKPAGATADEVTWPDCESATALRAFWLPGERTQTTDAELASGVSIGCLAGLIPPLPPSEHTGELFTFSFNCSAEPSSTEVQLLPAGDARAQTSGAQYSLPPDGAQVIPKVSNLTINCGEGGGVTPTPAEPSPTSDGSTPTDTPVQPTATNTSVPPTATNTPVAPDNCGDVNDDGEISSVDALFVLQFTAELLTSLPKSGDINGDGEVTAVDALFILQYVAGLLDELEC